MQHWFLIYVFFVLTQFQMTKTQRRIVGGKNVEGEIRKYMAYLIKAPVSEAGYDAWICGGAIVSYRAIVTSAACIEDVKYMYAVAGYNKYVQTSDIKKNECTKNARKKVVFSCVPITHKFDYDKIENWTNSDIGVVFVESDYEFGKQIEGCSWDPQMLPVNYAPKYQSTGTDAVVMGFGHKERWRQVQDNIDYNTKELQYAAVLIMEKKDCMKSYESYPKLHDIIDKYMICTKQAGSLDSNGRMVDDPIYRDNCGPGANPKEEECVPKKAGRDDEISDFRRMGANRTVGEESGRRLYGQTPGICQNDHGGPLITWVGPSAHLIGVASVFLVNPRDKKCTGPYLYTSTYCNSKFLNCAITKIGDKMKANKPNNPEALRASMYAMDPDSVKRRETLKGYEMWYRKNKEFCELPPEQKGFDIRSRRISWANHPDGPAENELNEDLFMRPQVSLNILRTLREAYEP